jgi:nitroimidazol reductase NimA-like FMN-containing flavoprotein (pyridoxamine 5'-phosphate oxidase superfamily)
MPEYPVSENTRISRGANRGLYDQESIYAILDEAIDITISYVENGMPKAIPNGFVRLDDKLYIHGSVKSHFIRQICACPKVCLSVSLLDGMVLANTAFNHSFNYRSVVIFSTPYEEEDEALKMEILKSFTDKLIPGRWEDNIKLPSPEEMKATALVCFPIEEASAKVRQGAPNNPKGEEGRLVWTGHIPLKRSWAAPIQSPDMPESVSLPAYLQNQGS